MLVPVERSGMLAVANERARHYIRHAKADNTVKAYRSDWQHFTAWCAERDLGALPASDNTAALYLSDLAATHTAATLTRRVSAISQAHQAAGFETPTKSITVRAVMAGIRRTLGTASHPKSAAVVADVRAMLAALPAGLLGVRDRALLLVGFAGAFRRSELVGLDAEDVEFTSDGAIITLRRSKSDQEGEGRKVAVPFGRSDVTCPVRALGAWIEAGRRTEGALFCQIDRHGNMKGRLSGKGVALVVKRYATAAGLDPAKYAGHSLRSGLATSAAAAGVNERDIMRQTGHRSVGMVRRYIREGSLFLDNAAAQLGL